MLAATHPAAGNQVFICGNPQSTCLEEMCRIIAGALGRKTRPLRLPVWPFFAAGALCEMICRPLRIEPPIYRRRVAFYTKDRSFDTSKLSSRLGYRFLFSNEEGLKTTALWYRDNGWLK